MPTIKETALNLIKKLPNDCTLEDIQYELYVNQKIDRGLSDIENNRVLTEEQIEQEIQSWKD